MNQSLLINKTILIADDYELNCELLRILVLNTGAIPLTAQNGKECVDIIKKQHVDMVLMDNRMPVMDGIEATKAIRALPQGKDIVIIGISGSVDSDETEICLKAGMNLVSEKLELNEEKLDEIAGKFFSKPCNSTEACDAPACIYEKSNCELTKSISNNCIMDYERALREFENDNDLLFTLIEDFNRITHSQLAVMRQALDKSDFECIRKESHGIKGGAANLCALPLSDAAKSLETACKRLAAKEVIADLLNTFEIVLDSFDKYVKTRISR